eukprot:COSAG01_NODE_40527_length_462_cov_2.933884_2_plen_68_part_00
MPRTGRRVRIGGYRNDGWCVDLFHNRTDTDESNEVEQVEYLKKLLTTRCESFSSSARARMVAVRMVQ